LFSLLANLIKKEYTHSTKYCHELISTHNLNDLIKPFLNSASANSNLNIENIENPPTKGETQNESSALTECFTSNLSNSITNDSMGIYKIDFVHF
jgi:hypothetical protein